jgi:tetratricopeptide (TPR) repeat protein
MPHIGPEPAAPQIRRQLTRMLESDVFARRPKQAALLKGMVDIALDEGEVTEKRLREVVYPEHDENSSIIRTQVKQLKTTSAEYYSGPGRDDLLHIFLAAWTQDESTRRQAGGNYMPSFEYNLRNDLTRIYLSALVKMNGGNISLIPDAMAAFSDIVNQDPDYVDAWLSLGDAYCWMSMLILRDQPLERSETLENAAKCVEAGGALAPDSWHADATRAFISMCLDDWANAALKFTVAMRSNRPMTESYPPYLLFRLALGEGSDLTESRALELTGNPWAQAIHGLFLEKSGRLDEAEIYYRQALDLDPNGGLFHWGLSSVLVKQGRLDEATVHSQRAEVLLSREEYLKWRELGRAIDEEDD